MKPVPALAPLGFKLFLDVAAEGLYLSESLDLPVVFFRLGAGILHSMEKATQFVPIRQSVSMAWGIGSSKVAHMELPMKLRHT